MMKRFPLFLTALLATTGCGGEDSQGPNAAGACEGGKCDNVAAPPLTAVTFGGAARCWSILDTSTDDRFFQVDTLKCELPGMEGAGVRIAQAYAQVQTPNGVLDPGAINAGPNPVTVAGLSANHFPATLKFTLMIEVVSSESGHIDRLSAGQQTWRWGIERTFANRAELAAISAETPLVIDAPFEAWPVVLWPGADLQASWDEDASLRILADYAFEVEPSADLAVGGAEALATARVIRDRLLLGRRHDMDALGRTPMYLYVPGPDFSVDVALSDARGESPATVQIDGPGYYVVDATFNGTPAEPSALPPLSDGVEADAGLPTADAGLPEPDAEQPPADADPADADLREPDAAPADPCGGACEADDVCVAGACVIRANQRQINCNAQPGARCDAGEDGDCAEGNGCVEGLCRQIACQTQHASCNAAYRACETNAHCAEDHACAEGLCVRLSCQTQHVSCNADAYRACDEGDDGDCAEDHACVAGLCRRLACQTQHSSCNAPAHRPCAEDAHCDEDHACVEGKCARRACQSQHASCNAAPHRACDPGEHSDCADDHACNESARCERLSCQ